MGAQPRLGPVLRELLPTTWPEWRDFLLGLAPLLGFFFFGESRVKLALPIVAELMLLEASAYVRITAHAAWLGYREARDVWPEGLAGRLLMLVFIAPFALTVAVTLLAIILLFNKAAFLIAEGCVSLAVRKDPDLSYLQLIRSLPDEERQAFGLLSLWATVRALVRLGRFFRDGMYRREGHHWLGLGLPPIAQGNPLSVTRERLEAWWHGLGERTSAGTAMDFALGAATIAGTLAVFPGGILLPIFVFGSSLGIAWMIVAKAFVELWAERLFSTTEGYEIPRPRSR